MGSQLASNIIQITTTLLLAGIAIWVAIYSTKKAKQEAQADREHARKLAEEDKRYQSRPILVPIGEISDHEGGYINWQRSPSLNIQNVGKGVALDIKIALYGSANGTVGVNHWVYWNNSPIPAGVTQEIIHAAADPSEQIGLAQNTKVDGQYCLYNSNDTRYRIGRLTVTYRDIFDKHGEECYVGVFDYLLLVSGKHQWMHLSTKGGMKDDIETLEYKRVNNARRIKPQS